jgi:hypothetical protein
LLDVVSRPPGHAGKVTVGVVAVVEEEPAGGLLGDVDSVDV